MMLVNLDNDLTQSDNSCTKIKQLFAFYTSILDRIADEFNEHMSFNLQLIDALPESRS